MYVVLNVYEKDMKTVKKECKANLVKIPFGIIRKLMKLFNLDNIENTAEILNIVMASWEDVIAILDRVFPDITEEDWDTVDTKELIQAIYDMLKFAFKNMMNIPIDPKN